MLFYFKALTTIMETFKLEMKEVDSSMKSKLIVGSTAKSPCLSAIFHSESNLSDNNSVVDQSENMTNKSSKPKKFQNIDSKIFKAKSRGNKKKDINTSNAKKYNLKTNFADKSHASNTSDIDQIKSKMTKFLSSSETVEFSNHASLKIKNIGALQTQEEIGQYSQMLYQHISNNKSQQNPSSANLNTYPHQNSKDSNNSFQSSLPSSLNIKTQINPRFLPSTNRNHVNKKK